MNRCKGKSAIVALSLLATVTLGIAMAHAAPLLQPLVSDRVRTRSVNTAFHQVGAVVGDFLQVGPGQVPANGAFLQFGPYVPLRGGFYRSLFALRLEDRDANRDDLVATLDVVDIPTGQFIGRRQLFGRDFREENKLTLFSITSDFFVAPTSQLELRVFAHPSIGSRLGVKFTEIAIVPRGAVTTISYGGSAVILSRIPPSLNTSPSFVSCASLAATVVFPAPGHPRTTTNRCGVSRPSTMRRRSAAISLARPSTSLGRCGR
jgi:hypothetical protein